MPYWENLFASQNTCCVWTSRPGHPSISFSLSEVRSHWQEGKLTILDLFPHHHSQFILGDLDVLPGQVRNRVLGLIQVLLSVVIKPPEGFWPDAFPTSPGTPASHPRSKAEPRQWGGCLYLRCYRFGHYHDDLMWTGGVWNIDDPLIEGFVVWFWGWANSGGVNTQWKHARSSE